MKRRVFRHARIHSGQPSKPPAAALAVDGEVVLAVGSEAEVRRAAGPDAELVDLEGACVLPGFNDAHIHVQSMAQALVSLDLRPARSLEEALETVSQHASDAPVGGWLLGGRWDSNTWDVPVQPTSAALDSVCPDRPAALPSVDGHTIWVNSRALTRMGIDERTPDPAGGRIVRDAAGVPTGILREMGAAVDAAIGEVAHGTPVRSLLTQGHEHLLSVGVTSVHDFGSEESRAAHLDLLGDGDLKVRVHHGTPARALDQAVAEGRATGSGDDWFRNGPVKLFMDGALGSFTCLMHQPLAGHPGEGIEVLPYAELVALVDRATTAGIAVATHAIGDRAASLVLDAYAAAGQSQTRPLRHRIEHSQHVQRRDVGRMASLGVIASMQPVHCTTDLALADSLVSDPTVCSYAWRSMLNAGVPLAFGSDAPVESPDPFAGLAAAATRSTPDGFPEAGWQPMERLAVAEALTAYTLGSAFAAGEERRKGILAPGYLADFVCVDRDPYVESPESIRDSSALATIVGGQIQWTRAHA